MDKDSQVRVVTCVVRCGGGGGGISTIEKRADIRNNKHQNWKPFPKIIATHDS